MKKQLLILSVYVKDEVGENILKSSISSLNSEFDILIATHSPINKDIQSMVKYYIYDHRNEFIASDPNSYFWMDYQNFYCEVYGDENAKHHSYAVYRSYMNAIYLMQDYYDDFVVLEGDCIMSNADIQQIKDFRNICHRDGKDALFFKYDQFITTLVFYSKMSFFREIFPFLKTPSDYVNYSKIIGSHGGLENYFYKCIEYKNAFNRIYGIENTQVNYYFTTSRLDLSHAFASDEQHEQTNSYYSNVLPIEHTEKIAFLYKCDDTTVLRKEVDIYMDDQKIYTLPSLQHVTAFEINPKNDEFLIKIGKNLPKKYKKSWITRKNNKSFIRLK